MQPKYNNCNQNIIIATRSGFVKLGLIGGLCFLVLSGCASTPTGNIQAFGTATKGVTDKIDDVIREFNQENINNELNKIAQSRQPITSSSFDSVEKVLIRDADKKRYALYKANKALGAYADSLADLARAGQRIEVDLAASKFYYSLNAFNEEYKNLTNSENDLISSESSASFGKVIAAMGSIYADEKRGKALKEIIVQADPYVQTISDVLIKELLKGVIEQRLFIMKHTELSGYIKDYNAKVAKATFKKRRKMIEELYQRYLAMQSSSASVSHAINAIRQIKSSHSTLKSELEQDRFSSSAMIESIGRLRDLETHYGDLETLLLSCETEIVADDTKGLVCKKPE